MVGRNHEDGPCGAIGFVTPKRTSVRGRGLQARCRWRGDLCTTLWKALGNELSGIEMRLQE